MKIKYAEGKQTTAAQTRVVICALVGLAAFALTVWLGRGYTAPLIAWDMAALVYLVWMWSTIWPLNHTMTENSHSEKIHPVRLLTQS